MLKIVQCDKKELINKDYIIRPHKSCLINVKKNNKPNAVPNPTRFLS